MFFTTIEIKIYKKKQKFKILKEKKKNGWLQHDI